MGVLWRRKKKSQNWKIKNLIASMSCSRHAWWVSLIFTWFLNSYSSASVYCSICPFSDANQQGTQNVSQTVSFFFLSPCLAPFLVIHHFEQSVQTKHPELLLFTARKKLQLNKSDKYLFTLKNCSKPNYPRDFHAFFTHSQKNDSSYILNLQLIERTASKSGEMSARYLIRL